MTFTNYLFKNNAWQIIIAIVIFLGLAIVSVYNPDLHKSIAWAEAIAGFGTLFFAAFIWINETKKRWEDALPKKLDAYFQFQGRDVIVFRNIMLFSESDARAWTQQLARQKAGNDIAFEPFFRFKDKGIGKSKSGESVKNYEITYFLTSIPDKLKTKLEFSENSPIKWCVEWHQIENKNGSISMDELMLVSNQKM
jgi:hypothetical protein